MKVLLVTDNPSLPSGLSRVGREIASVLHEKYGFAYLGLHYLEKGDFPYLVIPYNQPDYGKGYLQNMEFDIALTIGDPFHFNYIPSLPNRKDFIWISYVTIDSVNQLGKLPNSWQQSLSNPDLLITTSKFGQEAITEFLDITAPLYLPLGVDNTFCQLTDSEREQLRKQRNLDDYFVALSVNRNSFRKQLPIILKVALQLSSRQIEGYPSGESAHYRPFKGFKFLLSCNPDDPYGYNLQKLIQDYNLDNVILIEKTLLNEDLNSLYNMANIFVTSSGGEGFGLTILEAMKCGLPIIGVNYSSIPELVNSEGQSCGMLLTPSGYWTSEEGTELAHISPEAISEAIVELASDKQKYQQFSAQAIWNAQKYSWNIMKDGIIETIEMVEKKESKVHKGQGEISEVDLIISKEAQWRDFTYVEINRIHELEHWCSSKINDAIACSEKEWIALVSPDVQVQRGWLCELLKSRKKDVAVVISTCIDAKGRIAEGEIRCGANLLFYPEEGLPLNRHDKQIGTAIFSCVLINKSIFEKSGGFKENLSKSYFDIEYCLRVNAGGYKIIKSAKSIVLKTAPCQFDEKDGANFKVETESVLNTDVYIQYQGQRPKIRTIYGDLGQKPVKFPYRMALDLVCSYKSISFADVKRDINILEHLIENSGRSMIARNMGLGDVLSAAYFGARQLKLANPNIHLTFVTNKPYVGIVQWLPFVDEVLLYPTALSLAKDYDYFQDLSYLPEKLDPASQKPRPEIFSNTAFPGKADYTYDVLQIPEKYREQARQIFEERGIGKDGRKIVGIQATCESPIRVYAPEYLSELAKYLIADGFDILLFGQDKHWRWGLEKWNGEHLFSFVNQTNSLEVLAAMMERCDYAIAPDSGLMHLWAFMKKPTLALFGNINPENRCKYYPSVTTLYPEGEIDCIPCGDVFNPCPECSDLGAKGIFSGRCMRRLYPERVYLKFLEMIGKSEEAGQITIDSCPLCGGNQVEIINKIDFWDNAKISEIYFAKCKNDELVFAIGKSEVISYEGNYFQTKEKKFYEDILSQAEINRQMSSAKRVLDEYYKK